MGHHPMGEGVDPNPRIIAEKLVDPSALVMGSTAENLHDRYPHLTKERADAFAVGSQDKLAKAYADGKVQPDLVPMATRSVEKGWGLATEDEPPRPGTTLEDLAALKTPFRPHGRVTAGNAAGLNDGATACLLAAEDVAEELGLPVRMRLVQYAFVGVEPEVMGVGPIPATEKALAKAGLTIEDIGLFELNEAFAVQVLAFLDHFGIADDDPRVNEYGGAIAVGHPLASSGVRLMTQLARQFEDHPEVRYGLTAMCIGIGMGGAVIWENPHWDRHRRERHQVSDMIDFPDEVVTSAPVQYVDLPDGAGIAALITLDNGFDHTKPTTFGPTSLANIGAAIDEALGRDDVVAVAVTGKPFIFAVGADLKVMQAGGTPAQAQAYFALGHDTFRKLRDAKVPTFAFVNGAVMGGGLELALHCALPHAVLRGAGARVPRGLPRPGPRLGRQPAAAEPDRRRQRRHGDHRERAEPEPDAHGPSRPSSSASPTCCSSRPTSSSSRCAGPPRSCTGEIDRRAAGGRPRRGVGRRAGPRQGHRRHEGARRDPGAVQGARAARAGPDRVVRRRHRGRAKGARRAGDGRGAARRALRLRPGAAAGQAPGRRAGHGRWPATVTKVGVVGAGLMARQLALLFAQRLEVPVV